MAERRYKLIFYAALVIAVMATYGVYRVLQSTKAGGKIVTRPVVIALADLPEGGRIDKNQVGTSPWPVQVIPSGAFVETDSVIGRVTRVPVFKGEPLVPGRLAPVGTGPGIEVKIAPGMRAMPVRINDVSGLNGLIQPNARVDMLVTLREGVNASAKLFMQNLKVLAVGNRVERNENGEGMNAATATLEVSPQQAERIALAQRQGSIQLVLRGYGDPDSVSTTGATSADVNNQLTEMQRKQLAEASNPPRRPSRPRPQPAPTPVVTAPVTAVVEKPPARPDSLTIKVYRGGKEERQKFDTAGKGKPITP
jgi:pilus assembly protein CpaB